MKYFITALAGVLYAIGFPNIINQSFIITPTISIIILFTILFDERSLKKKFLYLVVYNFFFNFTGFYWIADTLTQFGELPYPVSLLLNSLFTFIVTPYLWVALVFIHIIQKQKVAIDSSIKVFSLAVTFTLLEYYIPQQFNHYLGSSIIALPEALGLAPLLGVAAYSFLFFLITFMVTFKKLGAANTCIGIFLCLLAFVYNPPRSIDTVNLNVRMVQGNISNAMKVDSEGSFTSGAEVIERYEQLSMQPSLLGALDLIIWPETAYPLSFAVDSQNKRDTNLPMVFKSIAVKMNANLVVGGYEEIHRRSFFLSDYNNAFHISRQGLLEQTYHKHILIPFGETLPFGVFNEYFSKSLENIAFFAKGEDFTSFAIKGRSAITTICYEGLKPEFIREYLNKASADFMINLTNDSWYGDTRQPYQHLFLTRWRAAEFNLPILRSTNSGITTIINSDGTTEEFSHLFKGENYDKSVSIPKHTATFYQLWGMFGLFLLWVIGFILNAIEVRFRDV